MRLRGVQGGVDTGNDLCGAPAGVEGFRIAREAIEEMRREGFEIRYAKITWLSSMFSPSNGFLSNMI